MNLEIDSSIESYQFQFLWYAYIAYMAIYLPE